MPPVSFITGSSKRVVVVDVRTRIINEFSNTRATPLTVITASLTTCWSVGVYMMMAGAFVTRITEASNELLVVQVPSTDTSNPFLRYEKSASPPLSLKTRVLRSIATGYMCSSCSTVSTRADAATFVMVPCMVVGCCESGESGVCAVSENPHITEPMTTSATIIIPATIQFLLMVFCIQHINHLRKFVIFFGNLSFVVSSQRHSDLCI